MKYTKFLDLIHHLSCPHTADLEHALDTHPDSGDRNADLASMLYMFYSFSLGVTCATSKSTKLITLIKHNLKNVKQLDHDIEQDNAAKDMAMRSNGYGEYLVEESFDDKAIAKDRQVCWNDLKKQAAIQIGAKIED